jgi:chorismate synthase
LSGLHRLTATVPRAPATVDVVSGEPARARHRRSGVCALPAAGVVAEAMVAMAALVPADAVAEKSGGDHAAGTRRNVTAFLDHLEVR